MASARDDGETSACCQLDPRPGSQRWHHAGMSQTRDRAGAVRRTSAGLRIVDLPAGDPRWEQALPVLRELRTHLDAAMLARVLDAGAAQGLRFTAIFDDGACLCVAGWRVMDTTTVIRKIYVDDLVTAEAARSRGCGRLMLEHIEQRARELGITRIELDSGVQRHAAHRFYLREL